MRKTPSNDALNRALGSIMEDYSWEDFQRILNHPARMVAWLDKSVPPEEEEEEPMDPEDQRVGELTVVDADAEQKTMELWSELNKEEQEKLRAAVRELWGKEGVALLPMSLR
jgi:hypothetical protein